MRITEAIEILKTILTTHGDLQLGMKDLEFGDYVSGKIEGVRDSITAKQFPDDPNLGIRFVAINIHTHKEGKGW